MRKFLLTATMLFVGMVATFAQVPDAFSWCGFAVIITMAFLMNRR